VTSVRAVEGALGITIPDNANSIRNIPQLNLQLHDHSVRFYQLNPIFFIHYINILCDYPNVLPEL